MTETTDILISGGGIAGLIAAASFGAAGFSTLVVDPAPPVASDADPAADLRSTAFLQPSVRLLEEIGLWERLAPHAMPLQVMRIVDAGGPEPEPRAIRDFDAAEILDQPFGWNLPNWLLRREIAAHLGTMTGTRFRAGCGVAGLLARETEARVRLSDGTSVSARLLVAADGRDSPVRGALGIEAHTRRYGQKALVFAVTHPIPHGNVSTEIHRSGGPFTLVPLPDRDGLPCSAVVWMETGPEAQRLAALPVPEFEAELAARSCNLLGPLTLVTRRPVWPIIARHAERLTGPRSALVAEAAHVVPPIGAQGLNMSLADIRTLRDLAVADRDGLGGPAMLAAYERARAPEIRARLAGIDLLNRASMLAPQPLRDLRAAGLTAIHGLAPIRRLAMKAGLGIG
ncbi:UbiH/UbiF family hydroxylase [Frigidibacter sp. MR17.14]|uniref:UbiH/UbiF family hydroxylase n=1 Tax=Frigidibacter sp. MR17.14 TaxID=3126509 RepID=UPI00301310EF